MKRPKFINTIRDKSKSVYIPGIRDISVYEIARFYYEGIKSEKLDVRSASIAYKFFLALFPGIIVIFTIIPYMPVTDFKETLMLTIRDLSPASTFTAIESTIDDIINRHHSGLLSIGFIMALYFSSNGFLGLINSFNKSIHIEDSRTGFQKRMTSIILLFLTSLILITSIALIVVGRNSLEWLNDQEIFDITSAVNIYLYGRWIMITLMIFFIVSFTYYLAPARKTRYSFFSPGSIMATFLIISISFGFGIFIKYFSRHNALYGSIGTLIIILMLIYLTSYILLIGFELNASIMSAKKQKEKYLPEHK